MRTDSTPNPSAKPRGQYVPMDVNVAFKPFGTKLNDRWGMEGVCAWMLLLAAAKRERVQGTFTYTSEFEAWGKLGAHASAFTFEEFLTFCGHHKQVRRRRSGRVTYVQIRGWEQWNDEWKTQQGSEQKSRKRRESKPDTSQTDAGLVSDTSRTEYEVEYEGEKKEHRIDRPEIEGWESLDLVPSQVQFALSLPKEVRDRAWKQTKRAGDRVSSRAAYFDRCLKTEALKLPQPESPQQRFERLSAWMRNAGALFASHADRVDELRLMGATDHDIQQIVREAA